jgi:16S rRNA processing protein RimM
LLGTFGRAHGLKGEVRLKSHTGDPAAIAGYGALSASGNRTFTLRDVRPAPGADSGMLIARVDGVSTREAAEALNRVDLYLPRDRLPPPEAEDEFLLADLIGCLACDAAGTPVGTVVDVANFGGGDLLEIAERGKGPSAYLPFTRDFVPEVDLDARRLTVALPEDFFAPPQAAPADSSEEDSPREDGA